MNNQVDFNKVIENLSTQIANQAQQIAVLQAILQEISIVGEAETEVVEPVAGD
jgi:alpha-D-ribose 1-methylphosphonate 5-triphosphate synthase subunit PhnG